MYIFGGETATNILASNDFHVITLEHSDEPEMEYSMIPAFPTIEGERTPAGRTNHCACAFHGNIVIYGGSKEGGEVIEEKSSLWFWNLERKLWDVIKPAENSPGPGPRQTAKLFADETRIILLGGVDASGSHASDLWQFDVASRIWSQLPTAPVATSNATLYNHQLWLISSSDYMSSQIHHLDISPSDHKDEWESLTFPTNPLAPGPRARHDGAFLPVSTGWGRNYLVYLLGARGNPSSKRPSSGKEDLNEEVSQWSDAWVLQIPSSDLDAKAAWSLKEAIKPAKIKDAIRSAIGAETGHLNWAEAVVQVPADEGLFEDEQEGKLHPGPRAFFGADVMEKGDGVVFWGGVDAKGHRVGDGWIVKFE